MTTKGEEFLGLIFGLVIVVVVVVVGVFGWIFSSSMEASAFNKVTGKNVTTWEAMWVELRIQGEIEDGN